MHTLDETLTKSADPKQEPNEKIFSERLQQLAWYKAHRTTGSVVVKQSMFQCHLEREELLRDVCGESQ